jgi:hypothetical protein
MVSASLTGLAAPGSAALDRAAMWLASLLSGVLRIALGYTKLERLLMRSTRRC